MVCLFALRFNIQVNNFSVVEGWSHCLQGINQLSRELMSLAQLYNSVLKPGSEVIKLFSCSTRMHKIETAQIN